MKRSKWVRLIAVILIISMLAAPVSAAPFRGNDGVRTNGVVGIIVEIIRDIIRDIFDDWFDKPGEEEPVPTNPITPTQPGETEPGVTDPTTPGETKPTQPGETEPTTPGETKPTQPGETEPGETDPTTPDETEPEEEAPEMELNLVEGHANTQNGQLLRGVTYTLSQVIAQQGDPLRATTAQKGQPLTSPFGKQSKTQTAPYALRSNGLSTFASAPSVMPMADNSTYVRLNITFDENGNAIIPDGTYLVHFVSDQYATYMTNTNVTSPWNTEVRGGTTNQASATRFTFARQNDGTYAIKGPSGWYLNLHEENASQMQSSANYLRITKADNSNNVLIQNISNDLYLASLDAGTYFSQGNYYFGGSTESAPFELYYQPDPADSSRDIPLNVLEVSTGNYQAGQATEGPAGFAVDNNPNTLWHTDWYGTSRDDHWFQFELSEDYIVDGLRYWPRQSGNSNGTITEYKIQVSDDGENFRDVATGNWEANRNWKIAQFGGENVKYVRLVAVDATTDNQYVFASAAEIRLTGEVAPIEEPEEPEQPESPVELVYFPVTMFNYNNGTTLLNDDSIMRNLTHQAEVKAGLKEKWEGLYFSGGSPASTSYTYTASAETHTDLTWRQVMNGTYYADETCTTQAVVSEIIEGSDEYEAVSISVGDIWAAFGGNADDTWYPTNYKYNNRGTYCTVAIRRPSGASYYTLGYQGNASMPDFYYHLGDYVASDIASLYAVAGIVTGYNLVAGGQTLATLNGTNTDEQIGVSLYTSGGTKTVHKFYSKWNWWAYRDNADGGTNDQNKFYTGLVQDKLVDGEIQFNVVEPGIFTFDSSDPTITNDGIKDIYQNVGLPFVKNATREGFYTFDSDAHGTYFKDKNGDTKSDPGYGASDDYFEMYFDYQNRQGWSGMYYGDGSSNLWAPFNTNANDTSEGNIDYHFGMRADIPFSMTPNGCVKSTDDNSEHIEFSFAGDDDVWIFIDGHLVIDLGGIHNRIGATIDFADNTITYERPETNTNTLPIGSYNNPDQYPLNDDGTITVKLYNDTNGEGALGQTRNDFSSEEEHVMSIFYLERGKGTSNCKIEFNLPMRDTVLITKDATLSWSEAADEKDGEDGDGTEKLTAKEQAAVDKLNFGFTLFKKTADETEFTAVTNTNFFVQDKSGKVIATSSTDSNGRFYLKNGQTAKFMTDIPTEGITYYVVEDATPEGFLTPDYNYAGLATWGFDYEGWALDVDSDEENAVKFVKDSVTDASEIPEHELPMNATENKSYEITVKGSVESIDSVEFICTNYLDADLPNPSALAYEDMIVIDYGLPVQIDPLANDLFRGDNIEIVAWGDESLTLNEVLDDDGNAIPHEIEGGTSWTYNELPNVPAARLGSNANFTGDIIDVTDCLFTFTKNGDNTWVVSSTDANGNTVYLQPYASTNGYPVVSSSVNVTISAGEGNNTVRFYGNDGFLHFYRNGNNYYDHVKSYEDFAAATSFYLYAKQEDGTYAPIEGMDAIVSGKKYLIVADAGSHGKFITYPTTSNANGKYTQVAKLTSLENSYLFDFGNVTFNDVTYTETPILDANGEETGKYTYTRDTFEYELTKQLTEVEVIHYIIKVTSSEVQDGTQITNTACRYSLAKVYIAPATIMYYEENFSDMITFEGSGWNPDTTVANNDNVSDFQEPGVVGTIGDSTYGSDVAYLSDNGDSNGTYHFGNTSNGAIRFTYTFTGTGTTIFARTSAKTGYMQVKMYTVGEDGEETLHSTNYRDTYWKDLNGTDLDSTGTLYNIPVFTEEFQEYGTYKVVCTVAKAGTATAGNDNGSGNEFYLDGIRVMQPLNIVVEEDAVYDDETGEMISDVVYEELTGKAMSAYATDGESNLEVVTLRQKLITDNEIPFDPENGEVEQQWPFVVLTDINDQIVLASDYISIGPKEEVYLSKNTGATNGQSVSFSLKYWQPEGLKLYMGMKAPFGTAKVNVGHNTYELKNAPDCYYDVTNNYASLVTKYEQATDENGYLLFNDPNDNEVYMDDNGEFYYSSNGAAVPAETVLTPKDDLNQPYFVVTYTFEAAESIVSLTNIKVVGQYEFTIVENTDITVDGDEGGDFSDPNEP